MTELPEELTDVYDSYKRRNDFESRLAKMNTEAGTNVSYDVMNRYVRLYNAHRVNETPSPSRGNYAMTTSRALIIRNRMKQLVEENPGLVKLWNLPYNSNPFMAYGPPINAITDDKIYQSKYM